MTKEWEMIYGLMFLAEAQPMMRALDDWGVCIAEATVNIDSAPRPHPPVHNGIRYPHTRVAGGVRGRQREHVLGLPFDPRGLARPRSHVQLPILRQESQAHALILFI